MAASHLIGTALPQETVAGILEVGRLIKKKKTQVISMPHAVKLNHLPKTPLSLK
jgi:hypothetical protein